MGFRKLCILGLLSLATAACSSTGGYRPTRTTFYSTPSGAILSLDGSAIGATPCSFTLPDKDSVDIKVSKPGYWTVSEALKRDPVEPEAPAGVGWFATYSYPLRRKRS